VVQRKLPHSAEPGGAPGVGNAYFQRMARFSGWCERGMHLRISAVMEPPKTSGAARRWVWLAVFLLLAAGIVWFFTATAPARERAAAASELRRMGFEAGQRRGPSIWNWRNLWETFRKGGGKGANADAQEWADRVRLMSSSATSLDAFAPALVRFQPKQVLLGFCGSLRDVSALKAFPELERLDFYECPLVIDFTIMNEFPKLQEITFHRSPALRSLGMVKAGANLVSLHITDCDALSDFDALRSFTSLRKLWLANCAKLQNTDALRGLALLEEVNLAQCPALMDVTGLHALPRLKTVRLDKCTSLSADAVAALRAALPAAKVVFP
jgi:hypothetical protein